MTAQAELQHTLNLGDDCGYMSFAEAAFYITKSRAELCELILAGHIRQVQGDFVDRMSVHAYAERQPNQADRKTRDPARLPRITESALWLLADWGGSARVNHIGVGMEIRWQNADILIKKALKSGYVERARDGAYRLTEAGWEYVKKFRNPL